VIETLALEARALARAGAGAQAPEQLDAALAQAAPEGFVGLFADLGAPMADLLAKNLARRKGHDPLWPYLTRLVQAFGGVPAGQVLPNAMEHPAQRAVGAIAPDAEALTERELEVLRLFAAGMTSAEIAEHFVVSINTIKTQLKSVYGKLDAHSRAEAIAKARALHLLP
jgi:LuxR family transcriptional regulator, maltose regulon positive regulatory protein